MPESFKICGNIFHFSLLNTKGSASFSFASRSESDSRRLKVRFAAGSVCKGGKKATSHSAWPDSYLACFQINFDMSHCTSCSPGSACLGLAWLALLCNVTVKSSRMVKTSSWEQKINTFSFLP